MREGEKKIPAAYQAIFQNASLGIIISNTDGSIERVNPFAARLLGYREEELLGKRIEVLVPPALRDRHVEHCKGYYKNPAPRAMGIGMNLSAVRKDGTEFPVEISLAYFENDGKKEIVSFISDITLRKEAEKALQEINQQLENKVEERTQELSQALLELRRINNNLEKEMEYRRQIEAEMRRTLEKEKELGELKTRFVSLASHEFRTPLSGILTSASLIGRYHSPEDEEKRNRHVDTIKHSVKHLTGILNEFLSLDKLEEGRVECRPSTFYLSEMLPDLIEDLKTIAKKGQRIQHHQHGPDNPVYLDRDMLQNVLINLISNALKYSPEGTLVKVDSEIKNGQVFLKIQDQGRGIPANEQKHLFKRFFRAHNTADVQGTGLGLNIVQRYLELMGGKISFFSEENVGTQFTVNIPQGEAP